MKRSRGFIASLCSHDLVRFCFFNGFTFHSVLQFPLVVSAPSMRVEQHGTALAFMCHSSHSVRSLLLLNKKQYFAKWRKLVPEVMKKESNGCAFIRRSLLFAFYSFDSNLLSASLLFLSFLALFCNSRSGTLCVLNTDFTRSYTKCMTI